VKVTVLFIIAALMCASTAHAEVFVTSDGSGTYVGGLSNLTANGAYIGSTPTVTADGFYVDGIPKKKYRHKKWQKLKTSSLFKISSSVKTKSK